MIGLALLLYSCVGVKRYSPDPQLHRLAAWMTGDFSSQNQSLRDSDFFDIRLHVRRIWAREKGPEVWLYVEQAAAAAQDRPYRQRIYRLVNNGDSTLVSEVWLLPNPQSWAGAYKHPERFDALKPTDLTPRTGCAVYLRYVGNEYVGQTRDATCESNLRGATYAMSQVVIRPDRMLSWDQGFDADGKQVWGAEKGGYEFLKNKRRGKRL